MSQFEMDDTKIKSMAQSFGVTEDAVKKLFQKYQKLYTRVKNQYLAHIIRSLEEYIREKCDAPFFRITCFPSSNNPALHGTGCATYKAKQCFNILFDSALDSKSARVVIAHELGHLFWIVISNKKYDETHEPISSLFGIFTILDKNLFYDAKTKEFQHDSWQNIIADFKQLKNKTEGKFNLS